MSIKDLDILSLDLEIKSDFLKRRESLEEKKSKLQELKLTLENVEPIRLRNDLIKLIDKTTEEIYDIENGIQEGFYISETTDCIEKYKKILRNPIEVSFMGKVSKNNNEKKEIIEEYIRIARKYTTRINIEQKEKKDKITCGNCPNKKEFDTSEDGIYVCKECGAEHELLYKLSSCTDSDRVNMMSKYSYDREIHLRDCMNQYQGKQNTTVDQSVYDLLEEQCSKHHLLNLESNVKEIRFEKVRKKHLAMFLKELGLTKHYENINLIYHNLTGKKLDDISHLEDYILADFRLFANVYDKKFKHKIERTNFLNTHHVFYMLLKKRKHVCKKEDFVMLKTIERQAFHDEIIDECFQELGWSIHT